MTASEGSEFNRADVNFTTQMMPHHAQAVQMVVMAQGRDLSAPVSSLMEDIRIAQVREIETMADWLSTWDEPIPETSSTTPTPRAVVCPTCRRWTGWRG
jgi:uncharacterized protein (DUF305 family)